MPQLRDSGTHPTGGAGPERAAQADKAHGFDRIFGIETEYGVSVTGADRPCDAGQVAMTMFRPVVSRARSTNTYLPNGSRLYLDVGSHPEYATAEARDPLDALAQDLAGEAVMRRLALQAQERLRAAYGGRATIHVYKNNADSAGHSFGCHENYLVRRYVPLETIERELLPFLITRQPFTGAGRVTPDGFRVTQRADFLDEAVSSATTRARPMVNTRDEPHADPDSYRRLHVIIGDSNRSQFATAMKLATTHLVLCSIEHAARSGEPSGLEGCALADPNAANRAVSRDLTGGREARLRLADPQAFGMHGGEGAVTPLELQYRYLSVVDAFLDRHGDRVAASMPVGRARRVRDLWARVLDDLSAGRLDRLSDRVDWVAKKRLVDALRARRPDVPLARLEQIDMDYHDVANGTVYETLVRRGAMLRLVDAAGVDEALGAPPRDTRAALRGLFVRTAEAAGARYSCDWTHVALTTPVRREAAMIDPFDAEPSPEFAALLAALRRTADGGPAS